MINCWHVFLFFWSTSSYCAEAVNYCSLRVHPTAAVVIVGERVALNCTVTSGDFPVISWQLGTDVKTKTVIYSAPQYGRNGTVTRNQSVADGYSVINTADHKTTSLLINHINFSQSGFYVCQCDDTSRSSATTFVVVLASEPKISVMSSIVTSGKPVSLSCNISFNGSADISSNLSITDISGTIVNRTVCYSNNRLTSCSVGLTTIADPSVDQSYYCSVQLIANNIKIIYSRTLDTSLEWKRVTSAEIVMSNPIKCFDEKCVVNESIVCKTDENSGTTFYTWWQIQDNGSKMEIGNNKQTLVLTKIGRFTYQCQAYSTIPRVHYNATSKTVTIDVTGSDNYRPSERQVSACSIALTVACVIIAILTATTIVLYRKLRQKNASDANKTSTKDHPVLYASLDPQASSDERQREVYTEIQLPIPSQQGFRSDKMTPNISCEYETVA